MHLSSHEMKISIFGIGYVGAVTAACLAESGHQITAVDTDPEKVLKINNGLPPIRETELGELIAKNTRNGQLQATENAARAVHNTDISLICVGTPSKPDGSLNLDYIRQVCADIGTALKTKAGFHTVIFRSTMLPGSTENLCLPILEQASGKRAGKDFSIGYNPEFLRESTAIDDYFHPPKIVAGAGDKKTAQTIMALYEGIDAPRIATDIKTSEGVKYADNAWHAMKVGFANEMGTILTSCGVDSHQVMDIFCQDTKLNISPAYLKPGFAFGGSCLPKDVRALQSCARQADIDIPLFRALLESNDKQIDRAFSIIEQSGCRNIGLLGISFKPGTDDLRESPLITLARKILAGNRQLNIYDPNFLAAGNDNTPFNITYPDILDHLCSSEQHFIDNSDMVVIGHKTLDMRRIVNALRPGTPILDLVRIDPEIETRQNYAGLCW